MGQEKGLTQVLPLWYGKIRTTPTTGETPMKKIAATLVLMLGTTFSFSQWEVVTKVSRD